MVEWVNSIGGTLLWAGKLQARCKVAPIELPDSTIHSFVQLNITSCVILNPTSQMANIMERLLHFSIPSTKSRVQLVLKTQAVSQFSHRNPNSHVFHWRVV